jgi:virulence-associated protein VapD
LGGSQCLADFDLEMDAKAEEIAEKFHKEVDDVKRAIRAVSFLSTDCTVNLQNAKMWKIRTEVNNGTSLCTDLEV